MDLCYLYSCCVIKIWKSKVVHTLNGVCVCVCVCVCVWVSEWVGEYERKRESVCVCVCARAHVCTCMWVTCEYESEREREKERERERESVCVCVCVCVSKRESSSDVAHLLLFHIFAKRHEYSPSWPHVWPNFIFSINWLFKQILCYFAKMIGAVDLSSYLFHVTQRAYCSRAICSYNPHPHVQNTIYNAQTYNI